MVDQRTYAPFHQHFLIARLDMDVDGPDNTVHMVETWPAGYSDERPVRARACAQRSEPLRRVRGLPGLLLGDPARLEGRQRRRRSNHVGTPVAYKLVPGAALPHMLPDDSPVLRTAEALRHTLWVTPYHPTSAGPAGRSRTSPRATTASRPGPPPDRPIEDTDVVLWYVFGIHHITRMEDWPIMPVDTVSFWLKPFGFFDRNPALDV